MLHLVHPPTLHPPNRPRRCSIHRNPADTPGDTKVVKNFRLSTAMRALRGATGSDPSSVLDGSREGGRVTALHGAGGSNENEGASIRESHQVRERKV